MLVEPIENDRLRDGDAGLPHHIAGQFGRVAMTNSRADVHLVEFLSCLGEVLAELTRLQLAEFALKLDHSIYREERALSLASDLSSSPLAKVRREHASLRRLISLIAMALDRADERRGLEVVGKLRSVLLVHLAKEETLYPMLSPS